MCSETETAPDKFKEAFKKYKNCKHASGFSEFKEIFDPFNLDGLNVTKRPEINVDCEPLKGLKDVRTWEVYEFLNPPGAIFLKNPFTPEGQRYWMIECLSRYPQVPHITNIDNLQKLKIDRRKASEAPNEVSEPKLELKKTDGSDPATIKFYKDLRWLTFGYHHDWDTKIYREDNKCKFPDNLALLSKYLAEALHFKDFEAEAAIVNYYHMDSTLSGHQDRSEKFQTAPLFSISFGQTALFLIGGKTKQEPPQPMYLTSGDIVIMSGQSRLSYHGVPKILPAPNCDPWTDPNDANNENTTSPNTDSSKRLKLNPKIRDSCSLCEIARDFDALSGFADTLSEYSPFHADYVQKSRINLNIRQVLYPGQSSLEDATITDVAIS